MGGYHRMSTVFPDHDTTSLAMQRPDALPSFATQLKTLLRRNVLLKRRNRGPIIAELLFPLIFILSISSFRISSSDEVLPPVSSFPLWPQVWGPAAPAGTSLLLAHVPNSDDARAVAAGALQMINAGRGQQQQQQQQATMTAMGFASESDLETFYSTNRSNVFAALVLEGLTSLTLRMDSSVLPNTDSIVNDAKACRETSYARSCERDKYIYSGFLALQSAVSAAVANRLLNSTTITYATFAQQLSLPQTKATSTVSSATNSMISIYITIAFLQFFISVLQSVTLEKEKKIKETMFMMGLRPSVFWLAWGLVYVAAIVPAVVFAATGIAKGMGLLPHSNYGLIFLILFLYCTSTIALAFALSPFFSRVMTANIVGPFVTIIPSVAFLGVRKAVLSGAARFFIAMALSPMGNSLLFDEIVQLEIAGTGLQGLSSSEIAPFVIGLACATPFYLLLAIYLDAVVPQEYGVRRPWHFPITSLLRRGSSSGGQDAPTTEEEGGNPEDIEPDTSGGRQAVQIKCLRKVFSKRKQRVAVDDATLHINEGEIFVLLGHNGAGKSTLVNILCGLIPPTRGTASLFGFDIRHDMPQIRQLLGICPQQDVLLDKLTVTEHLRVFAGIKGLGEGPELEARIAKVMKEVDLEAKEHAAAETLSGGLKRRLSVALALIGNPLFLILDEPSTGMSPESRRQLWRILSTAKAQRCTLLTTHYMDEADALASRTAILSHGRVQCLGTTMFLKKRFGIGYRLDVTHTISARTAIETIVQRHVPGAVIATDEEGTATDTLGREDSLASSRWELPSIDGTKLPALLRELDAFTRTEDSPDAPIESIGINMPTMEQVFLKSAEQDERSHSQESVESQNARDVTQSAQLLLARPKADDIKRPSFISMVSTFVGMRIHLQLRQKRSLLFAIVLPFAMLLAGLLIAGGSGASTGNDARALALASGVNIAFDELGSNATRAVDVARSLHPTPKFYVDSTVPFQQWGLARGPFDGGFQLNETALGGIDAITLFFNASSAVDTLPALADAVYNAILANRTGSGATEIRTSVKPFNAPGSKPWDTKSFISVMFIGYALAQASAARAIPVVGEREAMIVQQLYVMGVPRSVYWLGVAATDLLFFAILPILIVIIIFALPLMNYEGPAFLLVFLALSCALPSALAFSYLLSLCFQKQQTARSVISGIVSPAVFIPFLCVSLISDAAVAKTLHYVFAAIDPFYPIVGILYYVNLLAIINELTPGSRPLAIGDYFSFENVAFPTLIIALVQLGVAIALIFYLDFWKTQVTESSISAWDRDELHSLQAQREAGPDKDDDDVLRERARVQQQLNALPVGPQKPDLESGLEDRGSDSVLVANVRKVYDAERKSPMNLRTKNSATSKSFTAVEWNSWGVKKGEIFGLLGPNGAGKTTSLSIASRQLAPTNGNVYVHGESIFAPRSEAGRHIGFCPQHDPLWPDLTVSEHLNVYGRLKGLQSAFLATRVASLLRMLDITEFRDSRAETLSGGTKRKLSFAISICGDPSILYLDEMSAGVDVKARRRLWDIVLGTKERRATILTTHSMEEADALATKIAIQVSGRLRCFGSPQHLRARFGANWQLDIALHSPDVPRGPDEGGDPTDAAVRGVFPNAELLDVLPVARRYRVPVTDFIGGARGMGLGGAFEALEQMRAAARTNVKEYVFSQTTLEQVFIDFAKIQV
ncbi:ATP-binding cassette sub- A member 5 [Geranomyces variabilis]|uniref:ATP-binding cassette sub- A member 5 n=1 Tax=Geranomyces variabilis TaxID=109894 RepID=A0AAD5TJJ3_9FUNG|nr:ATP-binding cassette sub- A member 5 [Geranomyces variabilis]